MVKTQRGKAASSSRMSLMDRDSEVSSDDEAPDEAPDEVTFEDSKAAALRSVRQALDSARRDKELLKEKRRKRQELFQEQKKRKLLPTDVLEEMESTPVQTETPSLEEEEDDGRKTKRKRKLAGSRNLKGNYTVTTVKEVGPSSGQQAAYHFLQERLYGAGSRRTTSTELLSLQNKKGTEKSAAVQFVKKDWASKEKAKAEKMKKRWIHSRQIPT